jgi:hypothetical protein
MLNWDERAEPPSSETVEAVKATAQVWADLAAKVAAAAKTGLSGSAVAAEAEVADTIAPPDDNGIPPFLKRGRGGSKNKPKQNGRARA